MERVVAACKNHPFLAIAQTVTASALLFVGTALYSLNREVGELRTAVKLLEDQVHQLEARTQRPQVPQGYSIDERRPQRR